MVKSVMVTNFIIGPYWNVPDQVAHFFSHTKMSTFYQIKFCQNKKNDKVFLTHQKSNEKRVEEWW